MSNSPIALFFLRFKLLAMSLCGMLLALGLAPWGVGPLAFAALMAVFALAEFAQAEFAQAKFTQPEFARSEGAPSESLQHKTWSGSSRQSFWLGWAAGLGYFGLGLHWIVEPFFVDAQTTGWMAPFALVGLAGGVALFWGLAFWVADTLGGGLWRRALALAVVETVRGFVFTGFPWALISHIWSGGPVLGWGALLGPYGLTLLTLFSAALPIWMWRKQKGLVASISVGAIALGGLYGGGTWLLERPVTVETPSERPLLRLVQPNAPQHEKWDPDKIPVFFNRMVTFSRTVREDGQRPDLIIWPESALTVLLEDADPALGHLAEMAQTQTIVGVQRRGEAGTFYHNSIAVVDEQGVPQLIYDKHHLVPFGEYMPWPRFWQTLGVRALAERTAYGYAPGPVGAPQILDIPGVGRALPLICYEAVFARHARVDGDRPDFLLQVTNDAWFGAAVGPWQHLEQARMRAIEQGLPMVRVANTGISTVIDARGTSVAALPLNEAGFLDVSLPPPAVPTVYAQMGDRPIFGLLALLCLVAMVTRSQRPKRPLRQSVNTD